MRDVRAAGRRPTVSDCTCEENDCPNFTEEGVIDYHHPNGGCLDCDCEATGPETDTAGSSPRGTPPAWS